MSKNVLKGMSILKSHPKRPSIEEQIKLFADTGFESVFLSAGVVEDFSQISYYSKKANDFNVLLEAVHIPSWGLDDVWELGKETKRYQTEIENIIEYCNLARVKKIVMHTVIQPTKQITEKGLEFFQQIERKAKEKGVRIAYENSTSTQHLQAVLLNSDSFHGFCYDFGHRNCYTPDDDLLKLFGERVIYTHIHDNQRLERKDLHFLPFDGDIKWQMEIEKLKQIDYKGTWNLELSCAHSLEYQSLTFKDFTECAYNRLKCLQKL